MNKRRLTVCLLLTLVAGMSAVAQEKSWNSIGALISPTNIGITYNNATKGASGFHSLSASADMINTFLSRSKYPGFQITYNYDFVLKEWDGNLGKSWFYMGPGVVVGFGDDYDRNRPVGFIAGLNLQMGYDYLFEARGLHLGVGINPILGYHLSKDPENSSLNMGIYHYGGLRSLIPQCRILCDLGEGPKTATSHETKDAWFEKNRKSPLLTFGIEASGLLQLYEYHAYNYISPFGREGDLSAKFISRVAAQVYVHGGFNIKNYVNLSLLVGYQGIGYSTEEAIVSTELRAMYLFDEAENGDRPLVFVQGGPGWDVTNENTLAGLVKVGGGYRVSLSPSIKLDFLLGFQFLYLQPKLYEDDYERTRVPNEYVGRNDEWIGALTFGASLNF